MPLPAGLITWALLPVGIWTVQTRHHEARRRTKSRRNTVRYTRIATLILCLIAGPAHTHATPPTEADTRLTHHWSTHAAGLTQRWGEDERQWDCTHPKKVPEPTLPAHGETPSLRPKLEACNLTHPQSPTNNHTRKDNKKNKPQYHLSSEPRWAAATQLRPPSNQSTQNKTKGTKEIAYKKMKQEEKQEHHKMDTRDKPMMTKKGYGEEKANEHWTPQTPDATNIIQRPFNKVTTQKTTPTNSLMGRPLPALPTPRSESPRPPEGRLKARQTADPAQIHLIGRLIRRLEILPHSARQPLTVCQREPGVTVQVTKDNRIGPLLRQAAVIGPRADQNNIPLLHVHSDKATWGNHTERPPTGPKTQENSERIRSPPAPAICVEITMPGLLHAPTPDHEEGLPPQEERRRAGIKTTEQNVKQRIQRRSTTSVVRLLPLVPSTKNHRIAGSRRKTAKSPRALSPGEHLVTDHHPRMDEAGGENQAGAEPKVTAAHPALVLKENTTLVPTLPNVPSDRNVAPAPLAEVNDPFRPQQLHEHEVRTRPRPNSARRTRHDPPATALPTAWSHPPAKAYGRIRKNNNVNCRPPGLKKQQLNIKTPCTEKPANTRKVQLTPIVNCNKTNATRTTVLRQTETELQKPRATNRAPTNESTMQASDVNDNSSPLWRDYADWMLKMNVPVTSRVKPDEIQAAIGRPFGIVRFGVPKSWLKGKEELDVRKNVEKKMGNILGSSFVIRADKISQFKPGYQGTVAARILELSPEGANILKSSTIDFADPTDKSPGPRVVTVNADFQTSDPDYQHPKDEQQSEIRWLEGPTTEALRTILADKLQQTIADFSKERGAQADPVTGRRVVEGGKPLHQYWMQYEKANKRYATPMIPLAKINRGTSKAMWQGKTAKTLSYSGPNTAEPLTRALKIK